jgi:hypothetical protein
MATGKLSVWVGVTGTNPESKPDASFTHGDANVDWVTVWFFCLKLKRTVSPTAAVTDSGLKAKPAPPTTTAILAAWVVGTAAKHSKAARPVVKENIIVEM